ncbi:MAG: hypothetical protein ACFB9M_09990 [Myxococcota bacterium]
MSAEVRTPAPAGGSSAVGAGAEGGEPAAPYGEGALDAAAAFRALGGEGAGGAGGGRGGSGSDVAEAGGGVGGGKAVSAEDEDASRSIGASASSDPMQDHPETMVSEAKVVMVLMPRVCPARSLMTSPNPSSS